MHFISIAMLVAITSIMLCDPSEARPISYAGGVSIMTMNDGDSNSVNVQYSPTSTYSIGYVLEHWRDENYNIHAMQVNNLLKRWNNPDSQGNLYLESGFGVSDKGGGLNPVAFTGITTDWEDRRFLVSYKNRVTTGEKINDFFMQSARVGVAPYIGEFGDLHTWVMVEARHSPEAKDPFTVTPLIRMFKGTNLVEAGISNKGDVMFNWMHQF